MSQTPTTVTDLVRAGMLLHALRALENLPKPRLQDPNVQVTRADLLQRVGRGEEALRIGEACARSKTAPSSVRARANVVLANEYREMGDIERTIGCLQKAIALCEGRDDEETKCWAELKLMLATSELPDRSAPAGFLSQVRKDVARLGDPHVTAALHLFVSQIEMKRGLLDSGLHHLRVGRRMLENHRNVWMDGSCAIDASCLSYLACDFEEALREAKVALRCGRMSGHQGVHRAGLADLGHLYLTSDQLDRAETCLKQALRLTRGGAVDDAILDGLAQVSLASGDLGECDRRLARIISGPRSGQEARSYYVLYALVTKVRLLLARGSAEEALSVAATLESRVAAWEAGSRFGHMVRLLTAEALLTARRSKEAADLVCVVADAADEAPLERLPRAARMIGKLHAAAGDGAAAGEWFEHAARALASTADERGRVEVLEDYADLLWPAIARPDAPPAAVPLSPPVAHPAACRVTVHPQQATDLAPARPALSAASALARASTLADFANRPQFVGAEVQEMLRQSGAITDAVIVASAGNAAPDVLGFWGDYARLQSLIAAGPAVERIAVGRWRDKDVELRVHVCPALDARTAVIAARKLVRVSLELDAARGKERERAALWPLDEPVEARHGVFASQAMLDLVATARKIGPSNATVLITGETGTGKEVLARIIHDASPRAARPFTPFNCAAVPRDMLDSQLFGHRRGAFTGAITHSPGVIRSSEGGTLLVDEIGEVALDLQPKLLRFLEAHEIQPLGEPRPVAVDVRVLASTNADLDALVASGRFREDLFYRINVIRLRVPPLRERREEIPMLVQHFLARFAAENGKDNLRVAEETMEYLLLYAWPGNVRQLLNQMRRLAAIAENGAVLMPEHLSPEIAATRRTVPASERDLAPTEVVVRLDQPLAAAVEQIERAMVPWALRSANGRLEGAAEMLGLSRKGLYLKRERLGLDADDQP